MTPLKAIRAKCLDCSAGSQKDVRECPITDCVLYQYRMGKNPKRKGIGGFTRLTKGKQNDQVPSVQ
jgi:hypothetical protein